MTHNSLFHSHCLPHTKTLEQNITKNYWFWWSAEDEFQSLTAWRTKQKSTFCCSCLKILILLLLQKQVKLSHIIGWNFPPWRKKRFWWLKKSLKNMLRGMFCSWIVCICVIELYWHKYGHFWEFWRYCVPHVDLCYESSFLTGVQQCVLHPGCFPAADAHTGDLPHPEESWIHEAVNSWHPLCPPSLPWCWESVTAGNWHVFKTFFFFKSPASALILSGLQLRTQWVSRLGGQVCFCQTVLTFFALLI